MKRTEYKQRYYALRDAGAPQLEIDALYNEYMADKKEYKRQYRQRPSVKKRNREYNRNYMRKYRSKKIRQANEIIKIIKKA
jgi:hypothetical protein